MVRSTLRKSRRRFSDQPTNTCPEGSSRPWVGAESALPWGGSGATRRCPPGRRFCKMTTIQEGSRQLLVDLFSRRGRLSTERFRAAYFANLVAIVVIAALSLLVSREISIILTIVCVFLTFFIAVNIATKRHRDTLPLHVPPPTPFRILPVLPSQSVPGFFCGFGLTLLAYALLILLNFGLDEVPLHFYAMIFVIGSTTTLATRFLWVAPSYPRTNTYGPNPTEVTP